MFEERLQRKNFVPFHHLPEGLYLVKQQSRFLGVDHYGVLITGKFLREFGIYNFEPIVVHQTYPVIRIDRAMTTGSWDFLGQVPPHLVPFAMARIRAAFTEPNYNLFTNNCEQVARFIAGGEKYSTQVRSGVFIAALLAIFLHGE